MTTNSHKKEGPSSLEFIEIKEIRQGVAILKSGGLLALIEVMPANFALKSAEEQEAIIRRFQEFINAIDFSLQVVIRSRNLDLAPYLKTIGDLSEKQNNELMRIQVSEYLRFIEGLAGLANIMEKRFFVSVPFYPEASFKKEGGVLENIKNIFNPKRLTQNISESDFQNYKIELDQRVNVILQGFDSMNLDSEVLNQDKTTEVFYSFYNPGKDYSLETVK